MANVSVGGFRPWGTWSGGYGVFPAAKVREVANNYGTAIGTGDIIKALSDGTVAAAANTDTAVMCGVVTGCSYVINGKRELKPVIPASTTFSPTTVGSSNASLVQFIPLTADLIMEVDANDGTTFTTLAGYIGVINENCDLVTGTPDATTGQSAYALNISSHNTTAKNFRVVDIRGNYTLQNGLLQNLMDNDYTVTRFKLLVTLNQGFFPPFTTSGV